MNEKILSTIAFKSNIQLVQNKNIMEDKRFLSHVRDPFGLETLYRTQRYKFTPIQEKEFRRASMHCAYAFKDDYPWGTIIDENGQEKVVCKCINTQCIRFSVCRPDFSKEELLTTEENVIFKEKISQILFGFDKREMTFRQKEIEFLEVEGDTEAASTIFSTKEVVAKDKENKVYEDKELEHFIEDANSDEKLEQEMVSVTFDSFTTVEQIEIIELPAEERTVVNAGPGTGKTWTLIEKIKYMLVHEAIEPENIAVLCFSRAAVEVVRNRLELAAKNGELPLNWHLVDVRTFDSFATYMLAWIQENIPEILPEKYSLEKQNYEQRIRTAADILKREKDMLAEYNHVIVDEVQDLVGVRAEMVLALLNGLPETCGFTLLGDSCQALYDYLAQDDQKVMSSVAFYDAIFHAFKQSNYYSLDRNYRQGDEFGKLTVPYRQAILSEQKEKRIKSAKELNTILKTSDISLKHITKKDAEKMSQKGSVGILTRTNGQALQISAWMRTEGIKHSLQKPVTSMELASWIANILLNVETDVIDFEEFNELFLMKYPHDANKVFSYWDALISTQIDQTRNHYEVEDLIKGLLQNARHPLLFEEPNKKPVAITVSNIHRAKGREFDSVLVLEDVVARLAEEENDDLLEHKVCYVALTRSKKNLEKVYLKPQYIYISKDEYRKCFRSGGFANKKYLSHYEIGDGIDLNARTFARDVETQLFIKNELKIDSRLKLLKCPKGTNNYVTYRIVLEEDESRVLGYTSCDFSIGMERAIQRIFSNYHSIDYKYFPNIFGEIYFDGLTTCVSAMDKGILGAKKIGSMYIWNGISISGFAQMEKDRY